MAAINHRIMVKEDHMAELVSFLREHSTLARAHPNQATTSGIFPSLVQECFTQNSSSDEGSSEDLWMALVRAYQQDDATSDKADRRIPSSISNFIQQCATLAIPRRPFYIPPLSPAAGGAGDKIREVSVTRVSPKKMHEVSAMSAYIAATFCSGHRSLASETRDEPISDASQEEIILNTTQGESFDHKGSRRPYIIDVGAGQGYLSRALAAYGFHVLALDGDEKQTKGSLSRTDWLGSTTAAVGEKREKVTKERGSDEGKEVTKEQGSKTTDIKSKTASPKADAMDIGNDEEEDPRGSVSNRTVFIDDADALTNTINEWIQERQRTQDLLSQPDGQFPIVVVGLHACGDLTPAILKFIRRQLSYSDSSIPLFKLVGCVVVGCCYNMMISSSFPLSDKLIGKLSNRSDIAECGGEPFRLDTQHLHLAAQAPKTWSLEAPPASEKANLPFEIGSSTALSMRKIAYRALLARRLPLAHRAESQSKSDDATNADWPPNLDDVDWRTRRIGRLATSVYKDFPTFLKAARTKLGIAPSAEGYFSSSLATREGDMESDLCPYEADLVQKIQVFQVLRCFLGPLVESLLVLDRYWFLSEAVQSALSKQPGEHLSGKDENVQLINLFDQSTGSLRNTALVWKT